jgi:hypothetical protein
MGKMKKVNFLIISLLLIFLQIETPIFSFFDGYENNYTTWYHDSYVQNPFGKSKEAAAEPTSSQGGVCSIQSSIVHSGSYAFKSTLPPTLDAWAITYKTLGSYYPTLYLSCWIMFNASIPVNSDLMVGPCLCGYNDYDLAASHITNLNGTLCWTFEYCTNSETQGILYTSTGEQVIYPETWYFIEILCTTGNGDGEAAMWVNGIKLVDMKNLANDFDRGPDGQIGLLNVQVGSWMPPSWLLGYNQQTFESTTWSDDVTVSTTYTPYYSPSLISPIVVIGVIVVTIITITCAIALRKKWNNNALHSTN